jgi:hypothetical protein
MEMADKGKRKALDPEYVTFHNYGKEVEKLNAELHEKHARQCSQDPIVAKFLASISNDVDETELDKKLPAKKLKDAKGNSISDRISASFFIHGTDIGDV